MDLLSGFPLHKQQTIALLKKNFILSWRSKLAIFLQLFSSFFFIAIMFALQKTTDYRAKNFTSNAVHDPKPFMIPAIPACEEKFFINLPCYDFVWSGSGDQRIESIVSQIMAKNPGRPIPSSKVKSFKTHEEMNYWLIDNQMRVPGALHFVESNDKGIRFGIQTNSSTYVKIGRQTEDPTFKFQIPLQNAASREIFRSLIGDPNFSCEVGMKEFAHPANPVEKRYSQDGHFGFDRFGQMFFFATTMFGFMFQIHSLVQEKELKLRQAMSIMGLYDTAYWGSWFLWEGFLAFLSSLFIVVFGAMFGIDLFLKNNIVLVFLLFFLFMLSMVGFAFMISNFIRKSASTTAVGFTIFIIGFVTMLFSPLVYEAKRLQYRILWSLFPPNPFSIGLWMLTDVSEGYGIRWKERGVCSLDWSHCYSMNYCFAWLVSTFFLYFVLSIYFDNILPNSAGVRKSVLYFLIPSYWTGRGCNQMETKQQDQSTVVSSPSIPLECLTSDDEDVREERNSVKQAKNDGVIDPGVAVQLHGLAKTYSMTIKMSCNRCCFCCFSCKCKMIKPYDAVKGLWMNFPEDQLFCLLGPNGAGKTTVISCLTGVTPVTHGDAFIYGHSIRSLSGMSTIRRMMGVCAQFDSLWDALSGQEHLELFASIKGLQSASHKLEVQRLLTDIDMSKAANVRAGSYSGGMKRRLSLAIALIGNPKLLILDEPTTGMDPVTRRRVWNLIEKAKQGCSIILTTHSMVEAEVLSDRVGIMAKGRLRCIGTSTMLKSRFGAGYNVKVVFSMECSNILAEENDVNAEQRKTVKLFFRQHLNIAPKEEKKSFLTFILPVTKEEILADVFWELECREKEFGIKTIQLGLGTLEDVFLNIARKAALEDADGKGKMHILTLTSGTSLLVPLGARYVGIPGTETEENPRGLMVEVVWRQDAEGNLCISNHSAERPVPPSLQPTASSSLVSQRNVVGEKGQAIGIVLQ